MSFQLVLDRGPIIDLGPTVELFTAFKDLARAVGPGDAAYPQLFYVPQTNDAPLPDWVVTAMAQQADDALRSTAGLADHTVWVLQRIARARKEDSHTPVTKYRDDQPRVPAGHPEGGRWTDSGGGGVALADNEAGFEALGGGAQSLPSGVGVDQRRGAGGQHTPDWGREMAKIPAVAELLSQHEVIPTKAELDGVEWWRHPFGKQCFQLSGLYVVNGSIDEAKMTYGSYSPSGILPTAHAWVELPGNRVFDGTHQRFFDKDAYYRLMQAKPKAQYTRTELLPKLLKEKTWGPWGPGYSMIELMTGIEIPVRRSVESDQALFESVQGVPLTPEHLQMLKHYGPGTHPGTGTEQEVHGNGGGGTATAPDDRPAVGLSEHGWYSFPRGGAFRDRHIVSVPLSEALVGINVLDDITDETLDIIRTNLATMGDLTTEPDEYLVYRVASGKGRGLSGVNAGTLRGVLAYLQYTEEELIQTGDHLEVYGVVFDKEPVSDYKARHRNDPKAYWAWVTRGLAVKYSPDQPREPAGSSDGGQWAPMGTIGPAITPPIEVSDDGLVYHGTVSSSLDDILANGLRKDLSGKNWPTLSRSGVVYVGRSLKGAARWAEDGVHKTKDGTAAILKIRIPKSERAKLSVDRNIAPPIDLGDPINFEFAGDIPPDWIDQAWVSESGSPYKPWADIHWARKKAIDDTEDEQSDDLIYFTFLMRPHRDAEKAHHPITRGYPEFDPAQDRDETGRWTSGGGGAADLWRQPKADYTGPYPNFPDGMSKEQEDQVLQAADAFRVKERAWEDSVRVAVSVGDLDPAEASRLGLDQPNPDKWLPLPQDLYHVTTAAEAVGRDQLRSRAELNQDRGVGLGGGDAETISFTDDPEVAEGIYQAIHEARRVATGEFTLQEMLDRAKQGTGANRPWLHQMIRGGSAYFGGVRDWMPGDPLPDQWALALEGRKYVSNMDALTGAAMPDGARPIGDGWLGGDGVRRYVAYSMPMTDAEQMEMRFSVYKGWSAFREDAGGPINPLFFLSDETALSKVRPEDIAILRVKPRRGARGTRVSGLGEWRTYTGRAVEVTGSTRPDRRKGYTKYSDDQPRVPAGHPDGGQWTDGGGASDAIGPVPEAGTPIDVRTAAIRALNGRSETWITTHITHETPWSRRTLKAYVTWVNDQPEVGPLKELLRNTPDLHPAIEIGHDEHSTIPREDKPVTYLLGWGKGGATPIHDHAGSEVAVIVTDGVLSEDFFITEGKRVDLLTQAGDRTGAMQVTREIYAPSTMTLPTPYIHKMYNTDRDYTISIHSYYPPLTHMGYYDFKPGSGVEGGRLTGDLASTGQWAEETVPMKGVLVRLGGVPRLHRPVVRGYPEFNEDQPRDDRGRWGSGGATAEDDEAGFQALAGQGDWLPDWASPLARTRLKEFELRVGGNDFETGFAIHAETGRIILENGGDENNVEVTQEQGREMRGQIFSHNHPGGRSFSAQDIATAAKLDLREVRVVGQTGYLYSMRPHGRTWPLMQELKEAYAKADEKAYLHAVNQINDGKMTLNEANALHHHLIWEDVAAKLGMTYTRKRWKSDDSAGQMELRLVRGISDGQNA